MKKMFYMFMFLAAAMFAGCAPSTASAVDMSVTAGADTNFVFRGQTMSQRGISANAGAKLDAAGFYVADTTHTVSFANSSTNLLNVAEVGYGAKVIGVDFDGGYTYYAFTGGATNGVAASNANFGEAFAQASAYGVTAKYAKKVNVPVGSNSKDQYGRLSYSTKFLDKFSATAGIEQVKYQTSNVRDTNVDLTAGYDVSKNLLTYVSYVHAGNSVSGIKMANQVDVGAKYTF